MPKGKAIDEEAMLLASIEDMNARLAIVRKRHTSGDELREWLRAHPELRRADVLIVANTMGVAGSSRHKKPAAAYPFNVLGAALRKARLAKNISTRKAAEILGVGNSTVAYWEIGRGKPGAEAQPKLKKLLGVDVSKLLANGHAPAAAPGD